MIDTTTTLIVIALLAVMAIGIIRLHRRVTELENGGLNIDVGMMSIPHDSDAGQEFLEHLNRSIRDEEDKP